jgi:D-3-phosphoglycerate dehydrogenase
VRLMSRPVVFLTHTPRDLDLFFAVSALAALRELADVRTNSTPRRLSVQELAIAATEAAVIVSEWQTAADAAIFKLPRLRGFVRAGVEILNVDLAAATEHAVLVVNTPGTYATAVAELTIGFMIALARRVVHFHRAVEDGRIRESFQAAAWKGLVDGDAGFELAGETLGLIGVGAVGRQVARLAQAFGMSVIAYDPYVDGAVAGVALVGLEEVLRQARFISIHCTLREETQSLIDEAALSNVRKDAYIINTARGAILDEAALARAIRERRIAGAAVDVYRNEQDLETSPLIGLPGVITTPHIAGHTPGTFCRQSDAVVHAVRLLLRGEIPPGVANPEAIPRWQQKWCGRRGARP